MSTADRHYRVKSLRRNINKQAKDIVRELRLAGTAPVSTGRERKERNQRLSSLLVRLEKLQAKDKAFESLDDLSASSDDTVLAALDAYEKKVSRAEAEKASGNPALFRSTLATLEGPAKSGNPLFGESNPAGWTQGISTLEALVKETDAVPYDQQQAGWEAAVRSGELELPGDYADDPDADDGGYFDDGVAV